MRSTLCHWMASAAIFGSAIAAEPKRFEPPKKFEAPKPFVVPPELREKRVDPIIEPPHTEKPKPLEIDLVPIKDVIAEPPQQKVKIVAAVSASASASSPHDATVTIKINGKGTIQSVGSGTIVSSDEKQTLILTAAHLFRDIAEPSIQVFNRNRLYAAALARKDDQNDLAVIVVAAGNLPYVDLVQQKPKVGERVVSWGLGKTFEDAIEEQSHKITAIDKYGGTRSLETDGISREGRSGGGLFFNDELCGVIQGKLTRQPNNPIYASIEPIRKILNRELLKDAFGSAAIRRATLIKAPFGCIPCDNLERKLGSGSENIDVETVIGPTAYMNAEWGARSGGIRYPLVEYIDTKGKIHTWDNIASLDHLERSIASIDPIRPELPTMNAPEPPGATQASGVSIQGGSMIGEFLSRVTSVAGDGSTAQIKWTRGKGAKDALLVKDPLASREAVLGQNGRIDFAVVSKNKLPVNKISFTYRFDNGADGMPSMFVGPSEIEFKIPREGTVGASEPVGNPLLLAYTIISIVYDLYELTHPTIDLFLGPEVNASFKLQGQQLATEFTGSQPSLRMHWTFMLGLVRFEYSRPLTGALIDSKQAQIQFHKSRFYRDINLPIQ